MAEKPTLGPDEQFCSFCGEIIKKEAEICPECGVRLKDPPKKSFWTKKKFYWLVLTPLLLVFLIVVILWIATEDTCEGIVDDVVRISKDDAPWIHQIYNVQEWSRTDQKFLCIGVARMSSGAEFDIQFFSEVDSDGNVWIGYEDRSVGVIEIGR